MREPPCGWTPGDDPTRIAISFDPREQRMSGHAVHGNTPFDVPYVSQITDNLWTGGCTNGLVLPAEIAHRHRKGGSSDGFGR